MTHKHEGAYHDTLCLSPTTNQVIIIQSIINTTMKYEKPNLEEMNLILEGSVLMNGTFINEEYDGEWF